MGVAVRVAHGRMSVAVRVCMPLLRGASPHMAWGAACASSPQLQKHGRSTRVRARWWPGLAWQPHAGRTSSRGHE
jgi:hypothetical protein